MYLFNYLTSIYFYLLGPLREISYEMYLQASGKGIKMIPGQKIYSSCYMKLLAVEENEPLQTIIQQRKSLKVTLKGKYWRKAVKKLRNKTYLSVFLV